MSHGHQIEASHHGPAIRERALELLKHTELWTNRKARRDTSSKVLLFRAFRSDLLGGPVAPYPPEKIVWLLPKFRSREDVLLLALRCSIGTKVWMAGFQVAVIPSPRTGGDFICSTSVSFDGIYSLGL